jgi:hypothetical protein
VRHSPTVSRCLSLSFTSNGVQRFHHLSYQSSLPTSPLAARWAPPNHDSDVHFRCCRHDCRHLRHFNSPREILRTPCSPLRTAVHAADVALCFIFRFVSDDT